MVEPKNLLVLTTTEAQIWLIYLTLLCTPELESIYTISVHQKEAILRVKFNTIRLKNILDRY